MRTMSVATLRCIGAAFSVLALIVLAFGSSTNAQVAPTSQFELDGTAASNASYPACTYGSPCDYWNLLNGTGLPGGQDNTGSAGHSSARTFISGTSSTFSFTGGGSKDSNALSQWSYSGSPTPNKDTFNHGYAAAYIASGDLVLTFGADRASTSGDANIGIWFFQQSVGPDGKGGFTGAHVNHDVFIVSAFTGGGTVPNFTVYEWNTACNASNYKTPTSLPACSATNLNELYNATNVCGSNITCATTNQATIPTSWAGNLGAQAFFSGGVDISAIFRNASISATPCFSSFLEETRSSQSVSAVLKDFLGGGFPVCGLSVTKTCGTAAVDPTGTFINYPVSGMVTNTGVGTLYNVTVSDVLTFAANSSDNTSSPVTVAVTPSTLGAGQTGTWSVNLTSTGASISDEATASGSTASSGGTPVTSSPTNLVTCQLAVTSTLTVTKSCSTTLQLGSSDVQVKVAYSGSVCNTGPSKITGLALADYTGSALTAQSGGSGPSLTSSTLGPCSVFDSSGSCTVPTCTTYSGSYIPDSIDATATQGRYFFNDQVTITSATASIGTLNKLSNTGSKICDGTYGCSAVTSCPICDANECVASQ